MDFDLRYRPWMKTGEIKSPEEFARSVEQEVATNGVWSAYGEFRHGVGPTVTIVRSPSSEGKLPGQC